ncbi:Gfo/Idh/MocA family protein [Nonomuraea sp. MTCD27]|uniref:Gfo/Idh/MocA family protein n=1 Tax=Nonomuraea sp. MTCD27 TaxID=1676747 RepID=UPI0035BF3433
MVTLAVVGAGSRGTSYARHAVASGRARVVAVADPLDGRRGRFPGAEQYADWRELAALPRRADAVIIATQDRDHVEPAVRFAELGYDVLLEKPMAVSEDDCRKIVAAAERSGAIFAVCHVLRYTPYTRALKALLDGGRIGEIVSVQHLEPVGWWHQAHSYVRGNWRRTDESTFMLLAKSCHDLDWLVHLTGRQVTRVSSFGGLKHFRPENRPDGAADRCLDCAVEPSCPYSARRIYLPLAGKEVWPVSVLTDDVSEQGLLEALRTGPYGRCVYACDNDVVDHQVVNLEFEGGGTASFTMTGFTPALHRQTRIFGTRGSIDGDGDRLTVHDFVTGRTETVETSPTGDATARGGHGGGDEALVEAFLTAVATRDGSTILSSPGESLHSHLIAWAAERSRLTGETVSLEGTPRAGARVVSGCTSDAGKSPD